MCLCDAVVCLSLISSTCKFLPCILVCFLQRGLTPVMLAVAKGHTDVVDMLVHKYNCSLTEVTKVSAFDVLRCHSPVGVRCHKCTSVSLPSVSVDCHCVVNMCEGKSVTDTLFVRYKITCTCHVYNLQVLVCLLHVFSCSRKDSMLSMWLQMVAMSALSSTLCPRWSLCSTMQLTVGPPCST